MTVTVVVMSMAGEKDKADQVDAEADQTDDEDEHRVVYRFELVETFE